MSDADQQDESTDWLGDAMRASRRVLTAVDDAMGGVDPAHAPVPFLPQGVRSAPTADDDWVRRSLGPDLAAQNNYPEGDNR